MKKLGSLLLVLVMLATCITVTASAEEKHLDVFRVAVQSTPKTLDPGASIANPNLMMDQNIFDNLMLRDNINGGILTSNLCESWSTIDEKTYEFNLKKGILFHNGAELKAEDVEYSIERIIFGDPSYFNGTIRTIVPNLEDVEVVDDYTVRVHMAEPDPVLIDRLSSMLGIYIVPKAYVEEVGLETFGVQPIGTGPYKVVEYSPERIVLEYFEGFYGERPLADRVEYLYYPEVSVRLTALLNGEVDMALGLYPENIPTVENAGNHIDSTIVASIHLLEYNTTVEPMDDPLLRKAMNLAIDREALCEFLWGGQAVLTNGYNFKEYGDYYIPDFPYYEYDVEQAKELVKQSKYNGETIYYELTSGYYTLGNEVAEAICSMWHDIGINAEVRFDGGHRSEDYHVHNWSNGPRFFDPTGGMWLLWGTGSRSEKWWQNADAWQEYVDNAHTLLTSFDKDARYAANKRMLELWEDALVGTVMFQISEITAYRQGLKFLRGPDFCIDFRAEHLMLE